MANAPLGNVRDAVQYAASQIPAGKILLGVTLYGYDWRIPYAPGSMASGIANNTAQNLAIQEQVPIRLDPASATPWFRYTPGDDGRREVWFDDALSVAAKLNLVYEFKLRGISVWILGNSFPQFWYLLGDAFQVQKRT